MIYDIPDCNFFYILFMPQRKELIQKRKRHWIAVLPFFHTERIFYYFKEVKYPMNPTNPNKEYTVSLNLDDVDQLVV